MILKVGYLYTHTHTHVILKFILYVFQLILVILFQFTMTQYTSEEGGAAILVCMILVSGSIGNGDVTIDVTSVGGTATPGKLHKFMSHDI